MKFKTLNNLITLSKRHGYSLTIEDLIYDKTATKFENWFKESKINALKSF